MSSEFWSKKLAGVAQPPPQAPPQQQQGAWWQAPQPPQQQPQYMGPPGSQTVPQQQWGGLQQQMPQQYPQQFDAGNGQMVDEHYIQQLRKVSAEELDQASMELIAQWELAQDKYNQSCPNCGSANFVPAGTKIGTTRMGTDKCFECGASSSTFTSSPEPALGGRSNSSAPYRDVRQIDTGGGAGSMYMKFRGVPNGYMPRA